MFDNAKMIDDDKAKEIEINLIIQEKVHIFAARTVVIWP